jgi:hypothetical protein
MSDLTPNDGIGLVGINVNTPLSNLDVDGSFGTRLITISSNYAATNVDHTMVATTGGITVTLPTSVNRREYTIRNASSSAITLTGSIDGLASSIPIPAGQALTVQGDGSTWYKTSDLAQSTIVYTLANRTTAMALTAAPAVLAFPNAPTNVSTAYNTSTGVFTAPQSGFYEVTASAKFAFAATGGAPNVACMQIRGPIPAVIAESCNASENDCCVAGTDFKTVSPSTTVFLTAGQTLDIAVYAPTGVAPVLQTTAGANILNITRVQ